MPDHIHAFIGLRPSMLISAIARDIKNNSANFINKRQFVTGHFSWQEGFGAFSYSHSHLSSVYAYIRDQKIHHQKTSFKDEYVRLLDKFEIDHDTKYLFEWYD